MEIISIGNNHVRSGCCCNDRSGKFGCHSTGSHIASCGRFSKFSHIVIHIFYNVNKPGIRIGIGIVREKSVNVRHQDQKIRADQSRNYRRKCIIISEFYQILEFIGRDRVILIYNRDHALCQKLIKGILSIPAVGIIDHSILGHQDLRHHLIVFSKKFLIDSHQSGLANCRTCLFLFKLSRFSLHSQSCCSHSNGSGRYQNHIFPLVVKITEFSCKDLQFTKIQSSCF